MGLASLHYKFDEVENPWSLVVRLVLVVALQWVNLLFVALFGLHLIYIAKNVR